MKKLIILLALVGCHRVVKKEIATCRSVDTIFAVNDSTMVFSINGRMVTTRLTAAFAHVDSTNNSGSLQQQGIMVDSPTKIMYFNTPEWQADKTIDSLKRVIVAMKKKIVPIRWYIRLCQQKDSTRLLI